MSNDNKFIPGLFFKAPHENAPDFIIAKGSIKLADIAAWLPNQDGEWVNFDLKESRDGKLYASIDDWKPKGGESRQRDSSSNYRADRDTIADSIVDDNIDDLPF